MKGLHFFTEFNLNKFLENKDLLYVSREPWYDFEDKEKVLGTRVKTIIFNDNSLYGGKKDINNNGEKLDIKIPDKMPEDTVFNNLEPMKKVEIVDPQKVNVYGEYRNMLSIRASGIKPVK